MARQRDERFGKASTRWSSWCTHCVPCFSPSLCRVPCPNLPLFLPGLASADVQMCTPSLCDAATLASRRWQSASSTAANLAHRITRCTAICPCNVTRRCTGSSVLYRWLLSFASPLACPRASSPCRGCDGARASSQMRRSSAPCCTPLHSALAYLMTKRGSSCSISGARARGIAMHRNGSGGRCAHKYTMSLAIAARNTTAQRIVGSAEATGSSRGVKI